MNIIPIVFGIDDNVVIPCGVTITSLLLNAKPDTFYDIYILYDNQKLSEESCSRLIAVFSSQTNCKLSLRNVGDSFSDSAIIGEHITKVTYYRLMIPSLFPQFDKIFYADIDIIFQQDLTDLYETQFLRKELLAAVLDLAINNEFYFPSELPKVVGKSTADYFNAGFLLMNLKQIREENIEDRFFSHSKMNYPQNDQDVLNVVCNNRVILLPSMYNFQVNHFINYMWGRSRVDVDFKEMLQKGTLHYTGKYKPWNSLNCASSDVWWYYYKQSAFYDDAFYFHWQQNLIESIRRDIKNRTNKEILFCLLSRIKKVFIHK